ncbi:sugar ABC transporter substrate-binding protein [Anaerocolumna chitinilytica]|uniref:Periplasmic binding protein domain-containing protein n=1 Tax=Anaerocolumna chitinilytica TaxID=1727145 RepID=A0A7I8DSR8_9FIRM|nr:substrate-binding domain-containing protein [Anaerocolumna chitinilytica]BCK00345.1 hypothetical protein bsdcttw_33850 [Anaerocolumna chitinilytica]
MKRKLCALLLVMVCLLPVLIFLQYGQRKFAGAEKADLAQTKEYEKHYVLIAKDRTTSFWQSVYDNAREEAEANNIYLEQAGSNLSQDYTMEDYLRISIASKVDGIIVCPDGSDNVKELINEAVKNNIPVVTVLNDDINTKRASFVGINSYELGQVYGEQIVKKVSNDTRKIYILFHSMASNSMNDVIFNQIKKKLNENFKGRDFLIQPYYITDNKEFDSEEAIRDLFISQEDIPDILVCMEEVDTECACQAIVDYNKVGEVTIIGSYSSDIILEGIRKDLAAVTVAVDTKQLGKQSVQALLEYDQMGYVNNFYNADIHIIDKNNVNSYH